MKDENKKYFDEVLVNQTWGQEDGILRNFMSQINHDEEFHKWDVPALSVRPKNYNIHKMLESDGWSSVSETLYQKVYAEKVKALVYLNGFSRIYAITIRIMINGNTTDNNGDIFHHYYSGPGICVLPGFLDTLLTEERITFLYDLSDYVDNDLILYVRKQKRKADVLCTQIKSLLPQDYTCEHFISNYATNPPLHELSIDIAPKKHAGLKMSYVYDTQESRDIQKDLERINKLIQTSINLQNEIPEYMKKVQINL